jgi:hypothetical protein
MLLGVLVTIAFLPQMRIACLAGMPCLLGSSLLYYLESPAQPPNRPQN